MSIAGRNRGKVCDDFKGGGKESGKGAKPFLCVNCGSPSVRHYPHGVQSQRAQQKNLTQRYDPTAPQKKKAADVEASLEDIGIEAFTKNGETYIKLMSVDPSELRELADALEKLGVSKFRGTFSYPK